MVRPAKGQRSPQRPLRWDRSRGLGQSPSPPSPGGWFYWQPGAPHGQPSPPLQVPQQASTARVSVGLGVCCRGVPAAPAERKPPERSGPHLVHVVDHLQHPLAHSLSAPQPLELEDSRPSAAACRPTCTHTTPRPRPRYLCAVRDHEQLHVAGLSGHWPVLRSGDKKPVSHPATARLSSARLRTRSISRPRSWPHSAGGALVGAGGGSGAD